MNILQLNRQFLWAINHTKSFLDLATRILSKIAAFNMIHDLNVFLC